jgi:hypothetical protein
MGGLITSSILTLLVLPWVNLGVEGFARWLRRIWAISSGPSARRADLPDAPPAPQPRAIPQP